MENAPANQNGMALAGGIVGLLGFILSWIPLIGIGSGLVLGILGIIFGGIGLANANKLPGRPRHGWAIAGLVLGIITVVFKLIPGFNLL